MSSRLRRNYPLLQWLSSAKPKSRASVLKSVDNDVIETICEVCLNVLKGNVPLSAAHKRRLSKHKHIYRKLVSPRVSLKQKRVLVQKGGFAPLFMGMLPMALPIVSKLLQGVVKGVL